MKAVPAPMPTNVCLDNHHGDVVDDLLTVDEAARYLHVPLSWVYEHARAGSGDRLPVIKVGKYLRFDRRDLRAYIDAKRAIARSASRTDVDLPALPAVAYDRTREQGEPHAKEVNVARRRFQKVSYSRAANAARCGSVGGGKTCW